MKISKALEKAGIGDSNYTSNLSEIEDESFIEEDRNIHAPDAQVKETVYTGEKFPQKPSVAAKKVLNDIKKQSSYSNTSSSVIFDPQKAEGNKCLCFSSEEEVESYRILRTQILHRTKVKGGGNTIMVTSAFPGEGKTLTAINLSMTFAKDYNQTVLLVDCDFRKQNIKNYLGVASDKGLIDYLLHATPLSEIILWPGIEKFTFISGATTDQESTEILGSSKMRELVEEMKSRYENRFIIFDVPPLLGGADAIAFTPNVDWILLVVEADKTSITDIKRAIDLVPREKLLGLVLNRQKTQMEAYSTYLKAYRSK